MSPALVRTVSVPGGMPPEMKSALQSLEGLFTRSHESLRSTEGHNGMKMLYLGGGFLNVHVARLNPDGTVTGACVSSLQDALRVMQPPDAARQAGEPEER